MEALTGEPILVESIGINACPWLHVPHERQAMNKNSLLAAVFLKSMKFKFFTIISAIGLEVDPFSQVKVTAMFTYFQIEGQVPVAKNIIVVVLFLFHLLAVLPEKFLFTHETVILTAIADAAFS